MNGNYNAECKNAEIPVDQIEQNTKMNCLAQDQSQAIFKTSYLPSKTFLSIFNHFGRQATFILLGGDLIDGNFPGGNSPAGRFPDTVLWK